MVFIKNIYIWTQFRKTCVVRIEIVFIAKLLSNWPFELEINTKHERKNIHTNTEKKMV